MCQCSARGQQWSTFVSELAAGPVLGVCVDLPAGSPDMAAASGVTWTSHDPIDQLPEPCTVVTVGSCVRGAPPEVRRAAVHQAVQHLRPAGRLAVPADAWHAVAEICLDIGLAREMNRGADVERRDAVIARRSDRLCVHDLMWEARGRIDRVDPRQLADELAGPDAPLVVDTRTHIDRCRTGVIAGSIHVPRTVVEWHLDPSNGYRHPGVGGFDQRLVIVCNGGYSSSLAAANLQRIGFTNVRDLVGGMRAWIHHGLGVVVPDHAHLDL
jgi:rhodanese-related sulfurtransferase